MRSVLVALGLTVVFASFTVLPTKSYAQTTNARLGGQILDQSGRVVTGVAVVMTNLNTNVAYSTKTNGDGVYSFPALVPGIYRAYVAKDGFKSIVKSEIELHTQDSLSLNFELQVGSTSETVTVAGNAEHLPTDNPAVGLLVDRTFVENAPLNGRSFQDLISLAPGVVSSPKSQSGGTFSINGQHDNTNYFTVDGVAANVYWAPTFIPSQGASGTLPAQTALGTTQALASIDSLQEFKIQTSGFSAEYGRQPGGQVELTSRSGTNVVHGSLFDYFRNDALDANSWLANNTGTPRQAERQNDFGGTVGGPVFVPKVYNGKNRTFFFFAYEGVRLVQPTFSGIQTVPSKELRQYAAPSVRTFLDALPLPNGPENGDQCGASIGLAFSCTGQWFAGYSFPSKLDSINVRLDESVGSKLQFFLHYTDVPSSQTTQSILGLSSSGTNTRSWTAGATGMISTNAVDEFRFNYTDLRSPFTIAPSSFGGAVPYAENLVVPPQYAPGDTKSQANVLINLPGQTFTSFLFLPEYDSNLNQLHQYNLIDSLSWSHGLHAIKFGVDYRRLLPTYDIEKYINTVIWASLSDIHQGIVSQDIVTAQQDAHPLFTNLSLYVEDHWKILSHLTLDYGLRWEFNPAPGATDGIYPLALTTGNPNTAQLAPRNTLPYHTQYDAFAPRLGFAYQFDRYAAHPIVVRGGAGIFYDTGQAQATSAYGGYPFSAFDQLTNLALPLSPANIAPPSLNFPLTPPYPFIQGSSDRNLSLPYTEQWNLSLALGLSSKNTLTTSYVGNAGRKLLFTGLYQPSSGPFTAIDFTSNAASSSYNALQVQDQGFVGRGLQLIASYTWSHAIDDSSSDRSQNAPSRGNSDNDVRNVVNMEMNCKIPGVGSQGWLRALTNNWSFDNRFTAQTGFPIDLVAGSFLLPNGLSGTARPDRVPGVPIYLHNVSGVLGGWSLNPAAFTGLVGDGRTPPGTIPVDSNGIPLREGTLGRNLVYGPAFWNLNTAAQRSFSLYEHLRLIFRVEAFNIFNHPNAGGIVRSLLAPNFGESGGDVATVGVPNPLYATGSPRSLQLMLKLQF